MTATGPIKLELEPGTYFWCRCGKSKKQPFCDGSHKDTGLVPHQFQVTERKTVYLCMCKHTADPPHCDGSHNNG